MQIFLLIAAGGALGAIARYGLTIIVDNWAQSNLGWRLTIGTMVVNILGCFFMGCIFAWLHHRSALHQVMSDNIRLLVGVGFLGAFTTFSTFSLETLQYIQRGDILLAVLNIMISVFVGMLAIVMGFYMLRAMFH